MFCYPWIPRAVIEELSSQRRNAEVGHGPETRETELNVLDRDFETKGRKSEGREMLKLLVKDKLLHSGKVPVNAELTRNGSSAIWYFEGGDEDETD